MPLESRESTSFDLLPTNHVGTRVVRLKVRQEFLRADVTPAEGQTVAEFLASVQVATSDVLSAGYGSYVLTEPGPAGDGYLSFHFAPANTTLVQRKLTPWSDKTIWQDHPWPDVLRWLYAVTGTAVELTEAGRNVTGSTTTRTSNTREKVLNLDRYELVRGGMIPTQVRVRRYLTSGLITGLVAEKPQPMPVRYNFLGMSNSIDALHDDITVPESLVDARPIDQFGTDNGVDAFAEGRSFFPRTNFLSWQNHIYRIEQSDRPVNGLYETVTYEALAPAMPAGQLLSGV